MSLKVWLPLNGNLNNYGISNITVTNNGATVDNNGKIGSCYYFNGSAWIKITLPSDMTTIQNTSICAWVKSTSSTLALGGISHDTGSTTIGSCTLYSSGWQFSGNGSWTYVSGGTVANTNVWHHVCCTIDDINITTYLDGIKITTATLTSKKALTNLTSSNFIEIGCDHPGGNEYLTGYVNDFRIYDHCLSALEVKKISQGLILHYKLNSDGTLCKTNLINWSKESGVTSATQSDGSVKIDCTTKTSSRWGIYCDIQNILPNTAYTFTVECKTANSAKPFQLSVGTNPVPSGTSQFGTNRATMNSPNGFTQYTATVVTKADTTWIRFYLACSCNSTNPEYQYAFVKNVNMTMGSTINTIIHDNSGYSHNGTIIGSMTMQAESPRYSACAVFNGADTKIKVPNLTPAELTISFWMKRNANTNTRQFMYTAWNGITCELQTGGAPTFAVNRTSYPTIVGDVITTASGWVHYCATFDLVNGSKLYQNGILKSTNSNVTPIVYNITTNYIGYYNTYYNGAMSDFRIYCTALSAEDVKKLYETSMEIDSNGNILPRMLEQ